MQTEDLNEFFQGVRRTLPKEVDAGAVFQSIRYLVGQRMTEALLTEVAWRLAGNVTRLRRGIAVPPWNRQADEEFVPVQISGVQKLRRFNKLYVEWSARVLAGTSVGLTVSKTWTDKFTRAVAQRLGFSKPWLAGAFESPYELYGMRFYVLIEPRLCTSTPGFETLWYDSDEQKIRPHSFYEYNRMLIRMRQRPDDLFSCPQNLPHSLPCHLCIFGAEHCPAATHGRTYEQRRCDACNRDEAYFDPMVPGRVVCVECHQRNLLRREE
jgi:hypothetical protein